MPRHSTVELVVSHIRDALVRGELGPGQRLPPEHELAEQLSVSRGPVREAMKMLAALGVVDIRQGNGTYVASRASPALLDPLVFAILLQSGTSKELLELRTMIEIGYCQLAAVQATEDDFARLEASLREWREYAASHPFDAQQLAQRDLQFHHAIIEMARNPLLARIAHTVENLFFASVQSTLGERGGFERAFKGHSGILAALRTRDPMNIHNAVRDSLEHWYQHLMRTQSVPDHPKEA